MVRVEGDFSNDKINGKIQRRRAGKVHTMLVIGRRDMEAGAVSVRVHGKGNSAPSRRRKSWRIFWRRSRSAADRK